MHIPAVRKAVPCKMATFTSNSMKESWFTDMGVKCNHLSKSVEKCHIILFLVINFLPNASFSVVELILFHFDL